MWQIVAKQTGALLDPYQNLIQAVCSSQPILVHLFLTALCHLRPSEPVSTTAVTNSLADALSLVVETQLSQPQDQVTFLLYLALNGDAHATSLVDQQL